jgi:hypothetical protein
MVIYALDVNSTVGFKYNANIVTCNATMSTSIYKGRGYTVMFFMVGHLILLCKKHLEFLDIALPGGSWFWVLPFAALIRRSAGGSCSRSSESGVSSAGLLLVLLQGQPSA